MFALGYLRWLTITDRRVRNEEMEGGTGLRLVLLFSSPILRAIILHSETKGYLSINASASLLGFFWNLRWLMMPLLAGFLQISSNLSKGSKSVGRTH
jgi:hypothetical protein